MAFKRGRNLPSKVLNMKESWIALSSSIGVSRKSATITAKVSVHMMAILNLDVFTIELWRETSSSTIMRPLSSTR